MAQPLPPVSPRTQTPLHAAPVEGSPLLIPLDPGEDPRLSFEDPEATDSDSDAGTTDDEDDDPEEKNEMIAEDDADGEGLGKDEDQTGNEERDDEQDPTAIRTEDEPIHAEIGPQPRPAASKRSAPVLAAWVLTMFQILAAQARERINGVPVLYAKNQSFWFPKVAAFFILQRGKPLPQDLYDVRWFLWDPFALVKHIPCPNCRRHLVRHGQISRPRRCVDLEGIFFIIGFRYRCTHCRHPSSGRPTVTFQSWDSRILDVLPPHLALEFPARFTARSGISVSLCNWMRACFQHGMGAKQFSDCVRVLHLERYDRLRLQYYHSLVPRAKMGQWRGEDRFEVFLPYNDSSDSGMHGFVPNATLFRKLYDQIIREHRGPMRQHISMLPLTVGAMDHSFKVRLQILGVHMCTHASN